MKRQDFSYELPDSLIARFPLPDRAASRLLCLDRYSGAVMDQQFIDIGRYLRAGDLLVCNDTRVIPARLFGRKLSGGQVEILIERVLDEKRVLAHVRASKSLKPGGVIVLEDDITQVTMLGRDNDLFELQFNSDDSVLSILDRIGHMPLPPYLDRADAADDRERYQTVFAREAGAVAAPTAGLHFTDALLSELRDKGVNQAFITLHVGAGTFQPVRADRIEDHRMHFERFSVGDDVVQKVRETKRNGGRVIAVGTTSVRCLESASAGGELQAMRGDTDIFIYPGYQFRCVDALITNFHLPESTLLMLVSAFAGYESVMNAYRHAVRSQYRFFSYGDAMLIS